MKIKINTCFLLQESIASIEKEIQEKSDLIKERTVESLSFRTHNFKKQ